MAEAAFNLLLVCLIGVIVFGTLAVAAAGIVRVETQAESLRRAAAARTRGANLPGELLAGRVRLYRIEARDQCTGLRRAYSVEAKHVGAAQMKARQWGVQVGRIDEARPT